MTIVVIFVGCQVLMLECHPNVRVKEAALFGLQERIYRSCQLSPQFETVILLHQDSFDNTLGFTLLVQNMYS